MGKVAVVRADFYSNGIIIPLGITYEDGRTEYINQVFEDTGDAITIISETKVRHIKSCCDSKEE